MLNTYTGMLEGRLHFTWKFMDITVAMVWTDKIVTYSMTLDCKPNKNLKYKYWFNVNKTADKKVNL